MFILAYRFRQEVAIRFPTTHILSTPLGPGRLKRRNWSANGAQTEHGRLTCRWHQLGPNRQQRLILARLRSSRLTPELKGKSKCAERIPTRSR